MWTLDKGMIFLVQGNMEAFQNKRYVSIRKSKPEDDVKVKEMIATAKAVLGFDILQAGCTGIT